MVCIYCGATTRVVNSRHQRSQGRVWRRRQCRVCNAVFTTLEAVDLSAGLRLERGEQLVPFSRLEVFASILDTCKHRRQPVSDAEALTATVINRLLASGSTGVITRSQLVGTVMEVLGRFDHAAATMYAAYHQQAGD